VDSLTDVAVFVRVVACNSFTRAADELELSRAVVSKYVARLEERLGVRLLNRTTRRLALTEAGAELFEASRGALERIDEAEERVARLQREPQGRLKVNAPMSFGILQLSRVLPDFLARHPRIHVDLVMDDRLVDFLADGFDVGIRIAELPDSSLVAKKVAPCPVVACAAPAYLAEQGEPATPEDLATQECILYRYSAGANVWRFTAAGGRDIAVAVSGRLRMNNGIAMKEAALRGFGIILLPTFYVEQELRDGTLRRVLPHYRVPDLGMYAVYPQRSFVPPKVRAFVEFLSRSFGRARPVSRRSA